AARAVAWAKTPPQSALAGPERAQFRQIGIGLSPELRGAFEASARLGEIAVVLRHQRQGVMTAGVVRIVREHLASRPAGKVPIPGLAGGAGDRLECKQRLRPGVRA